MWVLTWCGWWVGLGGGGRLCRLVTLVRRRLRLLRWVVCCRVTIVSSWVSRGTLSMFPVLMIVRVNFVSVWVVLVLLGVLLSLVGLVGIVLFASIDLLVLVFGSYWLNG